MKPIIFNTEMVKAILDGRKRQTRRVEKLTHQKVLFEDGEAICEECGQIRYAHTEGYCLNCSIKKSKYKIGDILYVKETFRITQGGGFIIFKAGRNNLDISDAEFLKEVDSIKWESAMHLTKEYARIFLKVTNVRVERLQDIDTDDCISEGIVEYGGGQIADTGCYGDVEYTIGEMQFDEDEMYPVSRIYNDDGEAFADLWNSTAKDGYKWEDNPYVFVYDFEISEREE